MGRCVFSKAGQLIKPYTLCFKEAKVPEPINTVGLGAIAALVHDVLITVGIFSLLDKQFDLVIINFIHIAPV